MKRLTPIVLLTTATLILCLPAQAAQKRWDGWSENQVHYLNVYEKCWSHFKSECGRNIVDDNLASGEEPSRGQVEASSDRMTRWLNPPPPPKPVAAPVSTESVAPAPTTTSVAPAPAATTSSSGGCPSYMAAEASSPSAVNPSSGAAGCYQILPSTAAANGCSDVGPDCAARICASQGNAAWASSGATPCDYLGRGG